MDHKQIVLTEAGRDRLDGLIGGLARQVNEELLRRGAVPGDQVVEVTASDVEALRRDMRLEFTGRGFRASAIRDLAVRFYMLTGIVLFGAGVLFPFLQQLKDNPVQLALMVTGAVMCLISLMLQSFLKVHRERVQFEDDLRTLARADLLLKPDRELFESFRPK